MKRKQSITIKICKYYLLKWATMTTPLKSPRCVRYNKGNYELCIDWFMRKFSTNVSKYINQHTTI